MSPADPSARLDLCHATDETSLSLNLLLGSSDPVGNALLDQLGPLKPPARRMASAILAVFVVDPKAIVFYSRDRSFYSKPATRRYYPKYCTYVATIAAVEALLRADLVEECRTPASPRATERSRLRAAAPLLALLDREPDMAVEPVANEPIVLKRRRNPTSKVKEWLDYVDTDETRAMGADVLEHNAFLRTFVIGLVRPHQGLARHLCARVYYRVFTNDLDHGGRWYGPVWQSWSKAERARLTINGEPTCELDIRCCQPRLLCASGRLPLPFDDPAFDFYELSGYQRPEVKAAFNILLNATSLRQARGALSRKLDEQDVPDARARASSLLLCLKAAWPDLAPYWHTGVGLRLQRVDSDMCAQIQAELRHRGIPVLSIHDSFVSRVSDRAIVQEVMDAVMVATCARLRDHPITIHARPKG